jgi:hypothetical protein
MKREKKLKPLQTKKKQNKTFQPLLLSSGYLFTYYNTKITEERKAQIERINQQVRDLYGPLLATVNASRTAYKAMVRAHSPENNNYPSFVAAVRADPEGPTAKVYRTWMRDVLQPLNERAAAIVVDVSFFSFCSKKKKRKKNRN